MLTKALKGAYTLSDVTINDITEPQSGTMEYTTDDDGEFLNLKYGEAHVLKAAEKQNVWLKFVDEEGNLRHLWYQGFTDEVRIMHPLD